MTAADALAALAAQCGERCDVRVFVQRIGEIGLWVR
jgi:hypothetical protein